MGKDDDTGRLGNSDDNDGASTSASKEYVDFRSKLRNVKVQAAVTACRVDELALNVTTTMPVYLSSIGYAGLTSPATTAFPTPSDLKRLASLLTWYPTLYDHVRGFVMHSGLQMDEAKFDEVLSAFDKKSEALLKDMQAEDLDIDLRVAVGNGDPRDSGYLRKVLHISAHFLSIVLIELISYISACWADMSKVNHTESMVPVAVRESEWWAHKEELTDIVHNLSGVLLLEERPHGGEGKGNKEWVCKAGEQARFRELLNQLHGNLVMEVDKPSWQPGQIANADPDADESDSAHEGEDEHASLAQARSPSFEAEDPFSDDHEVFARSTFEERSDLAELQDKPYLADPDTDTEANTTKSGYVFQQPSYFAEPEPSAPRPDIGRHTQASMLKQKRLSTPTQVPLFQKPDWKRPGSS